MSLGSPGGPDLDLTAMGWSNWVGLMVTTHFDLVSRLLLRPRAHCPLPISHCPLWPRAPLWAKTFFCRNIGMWGVQSVAMKRPAHRELFQPIWKHPAGENRQKHKFWVLGGGGSFCGLPLPCQAKFLSLDDFSTTHKTCKI